MMEGMSALEIVEVGPRDGLQNEDVVLDVAAKVAFIEALAAAGLRRIEAVGFVHPARVPRMAGAEAVMAAVPRPDGVRYSGLVLNRRGMDRAVAAGVDEINMVVVATDTFSARNQGMTTAEAIKATAGIAGAARAAGLGVTLTVGAAFGCPFAPAATGNIATEDWLYALGRSGIGTGIDMDRLLAASAYVEERLGHANPALLGRAGMFPALRSSLVRPARQEVEW